MQRSKHSYHQERQKLQKCLTFLLEREREREREYTFSRDKSENIHALYYADTAAIIPSFYANIQKDAKKARRVVFEWRRITQ